MKINIARFIVMVICGTALIFPGVHTIVHAGKIASIRKDPASTGQEITIAGHSYGDVINGLTAGGR